MPFAWQNRPICCPKVRICDRALAIDTGQGFPQFACCCFIPCANINANNLTSVCTLEPTRPTACSLCCPRMTIIHRIELLTSPFFGGHLHVSWHPGIFLIDVVLQPLLRHLRHTSYSGKRSGAPTAIGQSVPELQSQPLFWSRIRRTVVRTHGI